MFAHRLLDYTQQWSRAQLAADYFRRQSFIIISLVGGALAWLWIGYGLSYELFDGNSAMVLVIIIFGTTWLVVRLYRHHYAWSVITFLTAQFVYISFLLWLLHDWTVAYLFILLIVMAGALIGPIGAFVTLAAIITIELTLMNITFNTIGISGLPMGLIFQQFLAALVSWHASLGFYQAIDSAEVSASQASRHAEEARQHRAELQRTLKSLDLAYHQLQRANSELFQAREVADKALRFKAEFAAQVSHELRTSLNLILGFSETMVFSPAAYEGKLPDDYQADVIEIYRNSRHLLGLVDDILDLSKLEGGRMGLQRTPTDLISVLQETTQLFRPLVETKGLALKLELPQALPTLNLDRTRISQVVLNLLGNATRITSKGQILIRAISEKERVVIQVGDTGPGIAPEDQESIFETFYQLDNAANKGGTTGLGLAVSKQIVELHNGQMWVESKLGQGSTFSFALPLQQSEPQASAVSKPLPPYRSRRPTIVAISEQESNEIKLLQRHLENYNLMTASSYDEAKHLVVQMSARAVLINTSPDEIPDLTSLSVPVITCPLPDPQRTGQSLDVDCYLQKPVMTKTLQTALQKVAPTAKSLLIVDDNRSVVRMIERMAQSEQHLRVFRAYSGKQALKRIKMQSPDAIILDLVMSEGDGYSLISTLRRDPSTTHIPLIVVSGQAIEETEENGPISITKGAGFSPTEVLQYLQAIFSVIPPTPVERHTTDPPLPGEHPA